jgi:hypothetical protein
VTCRRNALATQGATLAPGSGDALENHQLEGFVYADVSLPPLGPFGARVASVAQASSSVPASNGPQWNPSVATLPDGRAWVTWTDLGGGNERPAATLFTHGSSDNVVRFSGSSKRADDQQGNGYDARGVALADGSLRAVWTDFRNQGWSIYGARTIGTGPFGTAALVDHSPTSPLSSAEGFPTENIHHDPAIAADPVDGTLYAAWADVRGTRAHAKIAIAHSNDAGATWSLERRADGSGPLETNDPALHAIDAAPAGDQFAPAIAVGFDHTVWVAWQDHDAGVPRVVLSRSTDRGSTFAPPVAVDPASSAAQFRPSIAVAADGSAAVAWEDARSGSRAIRVARVSAGGSAAPSVALDAPPAGTTQQRASISAVEGGYAIAFQDDRAGDADILLAFVSASGAVRAPVRVDDGPAGADARLPSIATAGTAVAIVWEDARSPMEQVRAQFVPVPAL